MMAQPHDPNQQQEQPELNPDGTEKKKRRQHTRWKEEEVMRLLEGVEALGVGHWRQMCVGFREMLPELVESRIGLHEVRGKRR
jgi:hypothetical protein